MLHVTLNKNDYIMIGGNIRLEYVKNNGAEAFSLSVAAPREMAILRKNLYEDEVEEKAAKGDYEAQILAEILEKEHKQRRAVSEHRRAKHIRHCGL